MGKSPKRIDDSLRSLIRVAFLVTCLGCGQREQPNNDLTAKPAPAGILERMTAGYRDASSYRDRAVVRLRYRIGDQWIEDTGRLAVKFERPNRLVLNAYQLKMGCDGEQLHAMIADSGSPELAHQVLTNPAPSTLQLDHVYSDPTVLNVIGSGMGGPPVTLELLIGDQPMKDAFGADTPRKLLEPAEFQGRICHRVLVEVPEGALTLWVDQQDYLLRRLEYPVDQLAAQMRESIDCREVTLSVDFRDARINVDIDDEDFRFPVPPQATPVTRFVIPPQPLPTTLLGKATSDFYFTDLDSERVTRESLLEATTVLVWFNDHPASQACLQQLAKVHQSLDGRPQIRFLAVCTEPTTYSNRQIQAITARWGVNLPTVRDLDACGRDVFQIPWAPTLVILDPQGQVQWFEVVANPLMREQLPAVLERLLSGEDVAANTLAEYSQQQQVYQAALSEVSCPEIREARVTDSDAGR